MLLCNIERFLLTSRKWGRFAGTGASIIFGFCLNTNRSVT